MRSTPVKPPSQRRWVVILGIAATLLLGLPLAHAFLGELGAVLLLAFGGGFLLGRMTAPC